ncbi:alpha amylase C-terminal domain-containing protein [Glycomyces sp. TRM65418]|uniref:carbohydrate-binding module family 20 domain-containing protein n=1 Tax=Glycomyces sp. TRM65418 TaxID=2867006 RepID=UPI001CE65896|nr:carbohydrate-binding module family 20 domain-containing protein [Glycomyces sp. TRM65418]MCC3762543.1 alpha amylase C-terminal domain-containing protein [Glycomyces sp. TRM65418]QZD56582.1 alpha amylase C-terminal domain-containing protein [Glycomyces sp. TRM65418]
MPHTNPARRTLAAAGAAVLAVAAITAAVAPTAPAAPPPLDAEPAAAVSGGDSILNMFEWTWNSIAAECAGPLADSGYTYVQTSPPQEHILGSHASPGETDAWYIHYQPVSYEIESRLGTRAEYANMIAACEANGIGVIADVVINHMAAGSATETRRGWNGSEYRQFHYPDAGYDASDFHNTGSAYCEIRDYQDRDQVQNCHLVGLNDLDTSQADVRRTIAGYLNDLMGLGVAGFRVDAAKHMSATDLGAIMDLVHGDPYIVQEVIGAAGEPITEAEYTGIGEVQEFGYAYDLKNHINGGSEARHLTTMGTNWGYTSPAGVFVANHDTERGSLTMSYKHGQDYLLGEAFMLAYPFGTPASYTGYAFSGHTDGPPLNADGSVADVRCGADAFTCIHRSPYLSGMAGFRAATAGEAVVHTWGAGDALAFGRGDAGHVVVNAGSSSITRTFTTSLPNGSYADVISGATVTVSGGAFTATVAAKTALAIHVGEPGGGNGGTTKDCVDVSATVSGTNVGDEVYIVGSIPQLGNWTPVSSGHLSGAAYPVWKGTVAIPAGTVFQYKYVIVRSSGGHTWESIGNRTATVPSTGCLELNQTWNIA